MLAVQGFAGRGRHIKVVASLWQCRHFGDVVNYDPPEWAASIPAPEQRVALAQVRHKSPS